MMGWSLRCYIQRFVEISLSVQEKKIFDRFFYHIGVWRPSWSCDQHHVIRFHFLVPESFHTKFGSDRHSYVVSEKIQFEFLYVHSLGPRSRYDLDLQYSHIFIYSIRCLLLLTFTSLAAIVSEKSTVFTLIGQAVLEKKIFEHCRRTTARRRTMNIL